MSNDIGFRLGVDGEKEYRDAIRGINSQIKNLTSEMAATVTSMAGMESEEENAAKKTDILGRSITATKQKIELINAQYGREKKELERLEKALDDASNAEKKDEKAITAATNAYNRQQKKVNDLGTDVNKATAELNKMEKELRDVGAEAIDAGDCLKETGDEARTLGESFKGAFLGGSISGAVQSLFSNMSNLVDETREYNKIMGTLEVSGAKAGYAAEETAASYARIYDVIGDEQQAATAVANLQAIGLSQDDLNKVIDGAIGAWATYGDSIPIDGLSEAINETIKTGKVTGTFADVLNWAGISEDEFNEKLAATSDDAERANLVMGMFAEEGLANTAEAWRENNAELVNANAANRTMQDGMAQLGEMISPVVTSIKEGLASIVSWMVRIIQEGNPILSLAAGLGVALAGLGLGMFITHLGGMAGMLSKVKTAMHALNIVMEQNPFILIASLIAGVVAGLITLYNTNEEFREKVNAAWTKIKEVFSNIGKAVMNIVTAVGDAVKNTIQKVKNIVTSAKDIGKNMVEGIWAGIKNAKDWLIGKVKEWCGSVLGGIKKFFGIKSPSRVMRDEVGVMLSRGMAEGIDDGAVFVKKTTQKLNNAILAEVDKVNKQIADMEAAATKRQVEKDLQSHEQAVAEKYKKLATAERKEKAKIQAEIEQLEKNWSDKQIQAAEKAEKEKLNAYLSQLESFRTEYEKALQEIEKSQDTLAEKLIGYGDLFTTISNDAGEFFEMGDLQEDIDAINHYGKALDDLKNRGISESLLDTIVGLNVKDATVYAEKLLNMSDEKYDRYMRLWEEKQRAAKSVAERFYSSEIDALSEEFIDKIPEELSDLKTEMRDLGMYSAQGLAQGFQSQRNSIKDSFVGVIQSALSSAKEEMGVHSPSRVWAEFGKNLALGLDSGFVGVMKHVSQDIAGTMRQPMNAITKDDLYKVSEATVNGVGANQQEGINGSKNINLTVNLDSKKIAEVTFDPLRNVAKQRGVAFG